MIEQVQVINGMKEGNITKALAGEHVGPSSANRTANRTGDYPADDLFGEVKGFERVNSNLATYF